MEMEAKDGKRMEEKKRRRERGRGERQEWKRVKHIPYTVKLLMLIHTLFYKEL